MEQSPANEGTVRTAKFPCATGPCMQDDEDYDPCGEGADITDKDLDILSKLDAVARAKAEEDEENEKRKGKGGKKDDDDDKTGSKDKFGRNLKEGDGKDGDGKSDGNLGQRGGGKDGDGKSDGNLGRGGGKDGQTDGNLGQQGSGKNFRRGSQSNSKSNRNLEDEFGAKGAKGTVCGRDSLCDDVYDDRPVQDDRPGEKPCHKKPMKNPFYTDRLALTSCLSPRPPVPPPQLYPPSPELEEAKCPKYRKLKPCTKKTETGDNKRKGKAQGEDGGGGKHGTKQGEKCVKYKKGKNKNGGKTN